MRQHVRNKGYFWVDHTNRFSKRFAAYHDAEFPMGLRAYIYGVVVGLAIFAVGMISGIVDSGASLWLLFLECSGAIGVCQLACYRMVRRRLPKVQELERKGLLARQSSFSLTQLGKALKQRNKSLDLGPGHKYYVVICGYVRTFLEETYEMEKVYRAYSAIEEWKLSAEDKANFAQVRSILLRKADTYASLMANEIDGYEEGRKALQAVGDNGIAEIDRARQERARYTLSTRAGQLIRDDQKGLNG